jgi:hypothetical protein
MPRYNLNQDDVNIIVSALDYQALNATNSKQHTRIRRLILRLQGKINALHEDVNTEPIQKQEESSTPSVVYPQDSLWDFYHKKD